MSHESLTHRGPVGPRGGGPSCPRTSSCTTATALRSRRAHPTSPSGKIVAPSCAPPPSRRSIDEWAGANHLEVHLTATAAAATPSLVVRQGSPALRLVREVPCAQRRALQTAESGRLQPFDVAGGHVWWVGAGGDVSLGDVAEAALPLVGVVAGLGCQSESERIAHVAGGGAGRAVRPLLRGRLPWALCSDL